MVKHSYFHDFGGIAYLFRQGNVLGAYILVARRMIVKEHHCRGPSNEGLAHDHFDIYCCKGNASLPDTYGTDCLKIVFQ